MLTVKRQGSTCSIPQRHSEEAAGCDIYTSSAGLIQPYESKFVHIGIVLKAKPNTVGIVKGRSGLSMKYGLEVESALIGAENEKELVIYVTNNGDKPYSYEKNERIAQVVFVETGCDMSAL